jgi:hypothetical protein
MRRRLTIIAGTLTGAIACMLVFAAMASALSLDSCRNGINGTPGDREVLNQWNELANGGWYPINWRWGYYNRRSSIEIRQDVEYQVWSGGGYRWHARAMYVCYDGDRNGTTGSNDDLYYGWADHPYWHIG